MSRSHKLVAAGLAITLIGLVLWFVLPGPGTLTVTAQFAEAPGLYAGNYVDVLGMPIGHVTSITPGPNGVQVQMEIPADIAVPRSAHAVLVASDVVNDRYVQFVPAYTHGPKLEDDAVIPPSRTDIPVSVDRIFTTLDGLVKALGPQGANQNGALSDLLHSLAQTFQGNGSNLHTTIVASSQDFQALVSDPSQLTAVLNNTGNLTQAAAANTASYEDFAGNFAAVTASLASENSDIANALSSLQNALGQLASFVHDNQAIIGTTVGNLQTFATSIAQQQKQLAQVFNVAPLAIQNLDAAVNPSAPGGAALVGRYDPTGGSSSFVQSACGSGLLRGAVVASNPVQRTNLDFACLISSSLASLSVPPHASAGPNLSLSALLGASS